MLASAQRMLTAPAEVNFGGVTVYLNGLGQQRLQAELNRLQADRLTLRNAIEQMQYIESVLGPMLEERTVPSDFRYLCQPMGPQGGGYWGLDAQRAASLNLRVDNGIDERLNVSSTSEAVLSELSGLHQKYPNWVRVLLSYANGQGAADLVVSAPLPPEVTGNESLQLAPDSPALVWVALARKLVYEREATSVRPANPYLLYDYRQGRGKSLATIARELGVDQSRFVPFNEWLRVRVIPTDKAYPVLMRLTPSEFLMVGSQVNAVTQSLQSPQPGVRRDIGFPVLRRLPVSSSTNALMRAAQFYEINDRQGVQSQPCDDVVNLAYFGNMSVKKFLEINDMNERDLVRPGEIYYLEPKAKKAKIPLHVVQPGQTMRDVSTMYGVRLKSLLSYNRMEANRRVQAGRIVWLQEKRPTNVPIEYQVIPDPIPDVEPTVAQRKLTRENEESAIDTPSMPNRRFPAPDSARTTVASRPDNTSLAVGGNELPTVVTAQTVYYTVRAGDTHSGVAQRYNLPLTDLMTWNSLSYRKPLVAGQRLIVAKTLPAPPAPKPVTEVPVVVAKQPVTASARATEGTSAAPKPVPAAPVAPLPSATLVVSAPRPTTSRSREYSESVIDVDLPVPAPPPARPRPERLVNQVRIETPKVNGQSFYHVAQRGQTVYRVALINKVSVQDLIKWNNLTDFTIEIGQRILIKKKGSDER